MVVFNVKFHFTFDICSHLYLFHFISWLLRTALRMVLKNKNIYAVSDRHKIFRNINIYALCAHHCGPHLFSIKNRSSIGMIGSSLRCDHCKGFISLYFVAAKNGPKNGPKE